MAQPELLTSGDVLNQAIAAVRARRPWSLIRWGDGEMLAYQGADLETVPVNGDFAVPWFKHNGEIPSQPDRLAWRVLTREAVMGCDCLGVHGAHKGGDLHRSGEFAVREFGTRGGVWTTADIHYHWLGKDVAAGRARFARLFASGAPVLLVMGHDHRAGIRRVWPAVRTIDWLRVPLQVRYFEAPGGGVLHYPDRFREVQSRLQGADLRGWLVLVAAGLIGKPYLATAKAAGAVALDIGSIADLWAGYLTRGRGKGKGVRCDKWKL